MRASLQYSVAPSGHDWQAVEADGRVRLLPAACIALRFDESGCSSCRNACPVECIDIGAGVFRIGNQCLGCGRCAAACPTGALVVKGFALPDALPAVTPLRIECQKIDRHVAGTALRVPCLGGLAPADWLELVENAGTQPVLVIDRGWCHQCNAGAKCVERHPAAAALETAAQWLEAAGVPATHLPRLSREPLPASRMPRHIPDAAPIAPARRRFLLRLGNEARRAVGIDDAQKLPQPHALRRTDRMPLPARSRLLTLLLRVAMRAGHSVPAAPFHIVEIEPECANHMVCAGICPTAALRRYEEPERTGIEFDALRCIGCGRCVTACPEHALRLRRADTPPLSETPQRLTSHALRICRACLRVFATSSLNALCPSCRRNHAMGASLFKGS